MKKHKSQTKSVVLLLLSAMLLSCENSIKEVKILANEEVRPELSGKDIDFIYLDSARMVYRAIAPTFVKVTTDKEQYQEFLQGGKLISYNKDGSIAWQIKANYAKNFEKEMLWEIRNNVEAVADNGKVINTELLYWNQKKKIIYSDKYVRITTPGNQFIEGTSFTSDEKFDKISLKKPKGEVFLENKTTQ